MSDIFINQDNNVVGILVLMKEVLLSDYKTTSVVSDEEVDGFYVRYIQKVVVPYLYGGHKFFVDNHEAFREIDFDSLMKHEDMFDIVKYPFLRAHVERVHNCMKFKLEEAPPQMGGEDGVVYAMGIRSTVILILNCYVRLLSMKRMKGSGFLRLVG